MSAFPYVIPEEIEAKPALRVCRPVPWTRLECGFEAQLLDGVPVRVRYPLAKENSGACSIAREELFAVTGVNTTFVSRWEESGGMVVVQLEPRRKGVLCG